MKFSRIIINGIIIFACIGAIFLIMEMLGLKDEIYLRLLNFIPVIWGINRTIKGNVHDHIDGYFTNLLSGIFTGLASLILGLIAFMIYVEVNGGDQYLENFKESYIFGGGEPSVYQFCIGLFLEGAAASLIVSFMLMQYWKDKVEKINKVDDINHNPA
ncbi:MAG: hypothetical protein ACO1N9_13590 [Flavobacterium sp.]